MVACTQCGGPVERSFRFCPWCALPQRRKLVEFFRPHDRIDHGRALRVSRYLGVGGDERHTRFSIWNDLGEAEAAISLDDDEARRLAFFVTAAVGARRQPAPPSLVAALRLGAAKTAARLGGLARR